MYDRLMHLDNIMVGLLVGDDDLHLGSLVVIFDSKFLISG